MRKHFKTHMKIRAKKNESESTSESHEIRTNESRNEEQDVEDLEELYQIEIVEGETLFVCNICDEGCETDGEVRKHVMTEHNEVLSKVYSESDIESEQLEDEAKFACKLCDEILIAMTI